jgi:hypothetical protein
MCAAASAHFQTSIEDVKKHSKTTVDPIDFEFTSAIVESSRAASANVARGKILACRNPDLVIRHSRIYSSLEWEDTKKGAKK